MEPHLLLHHLLHHLLLHLLLQHAKPEEFKTIKGQKWDTATSQGGQHLQLTANASRALVPSSSTTLTATTASRSLTDSREAASRLAWTAAPLASVGFPKVSERRALGASCGAPCLNGGRCLPDGSCDCALYGATGPRCQTVPNPGPERDLVCRSWGQYHFETFDGLYFYLPGRCSYTLLRDCGEGPQTGIVVQVHNDPSCGSAPSTCHRSVSLFLPWGGEVRLDDAHVTYEGQSLQLPHRLHDLQLERVSRYVLATRRPGFTLAWGGSLGGSWGGGRGSGGGGALYLKLGPEWVGRTCGLCGSLNADARDDLRTRAGLLTFDLALFANSWAEPRPQQEPCPLLAASFPSPCAEADANTLHEVERLCAKLAAPPFQSCHALVSPRSFMASCANHLCLSGASMAAACEMLTEYARACAHAGYPLAEWRKRVPECAEPCAAGLEYRECISCCPESCTPERGCVDSKLACLDGCYCPEGLIFEEGGCVAPSNCPCEYRGNSYPPGGTVREECNDCTCEGGMWNCTHHICPAECSLTGSASFRSFDGRLFTFDPAACRYVLAKSRGSGAFALTLQFAPCGPEGAGSCIQSLHLLLGEEPRSEVTLSHLGEVFVGGRYRVTLPYSNDVVHIEELSSMFLQVRAPVGLRVHYSWGQSRVYVGVRGPWGGHTLGLCGTFNGNLQDDFTSPSGMVESSPQIFGDSWRVSAGCPVGAPGPGPPRTDPCDSHQQAARYANDMCDVLSGELFSDCHAHLSPAPFQQQCRTQSCTCGAPCMCAALAHYARYCRRYGVVLEFRAHVHECAASCPATMRYATCVSSCGRRCASLSEPRPCGEEEEECEEGCVCPPDSFYNPRTLTCVPRNECPCTFLGADYEPGDAVVTAAGVQICVDGKLTSLTTDSDRRCPPGQVYQNCTQGGASGVNGVERATGRGVACERTCEAQLLNLACAAQGPCAAGCACPPGLLKHGDGCYQPDNCPCLWEGKEFYPGDRVSAPCHQCICQHGSFQCELRPCTATCTAYGDRHYRTFDGLTFDYVSACRVYLVKSAAFSVAAENAGCYANGGAAECRKMLRINVGRSSVALDEESGAPTSASVLDRKQTMLTWLAGYFTVVHFPDQDLTVLWDRKTTVHIQVGPQWQGKLTGLCGDFDLKTADEMLTPDSIGAATPQEFGDSWAAAECPDTPDLRPPCAIRPLREPDAKRRCAVLLGELFKECHPVVDVTWFHANCLSDACACERGDCYCASVAAYAQACCRRGVAADWRSPGLCPHDCEYYNKVLGKGPFRLFFFGPRGAMLAVDPSGGPAFLQRDPAPPGGPALLRSFMMTPGLSDASRVSLEAARRPNYFLHAGPRGQVALAKWRAGGAFAEGATFLLHRDRWVAGYEALESGARRGYFLHAAAEGARLRLVKYRRSEDFRRATSFRLTGPEPDTEPGPRCQWRYEPCASPCYRTCRDPLAAACAAVPRVEGCLPMCGARTVLDEVTRRCVHVEDCIVAATVTMVTGPPSYTTANRPGQTTSGISSTPYATLAASGSGPTGTASRLDVAPEMTSPLNPETVWTPGTWTGKVPESQVTTQVQVSTSRSEVETPTGTGTPRPSEGSTETTDVQSPGPVTRATTTGEPIPPEGPGTTTGPAPPVGTTAGSSPSSWSWSRPRETTWTASWDNVTTRPTTAWGTEGVSARPGTTRTPETTETGAGATSSRTVDTSPGETTAPGPGSEGSPPRTCTPPYAEILDECAKYLCVDHQLVLVNKSQNCPPTAGPPSCDLRGPAVLVNGDKCCPQWDCPCRCTVFPDLHVVTFDGGSVGVASAASYVVARRRGETLAAVVRECPARAEPPWNLCVVALNISHQSLQVQVDRVHRRLLVNERDATPRYDKEGLRVQDTGHMYRIRTPSGLRLQWYHSTGALVLDSQGPTLGLCGVCDGDPANDLTLANGSALAAGEDPTAFLESWRLANSSAGHVSVSRRREANCSAGGCAGCLAMLAAAAFAGCHAFVPPTSFCELWVRDAAYVADRCTALAAYVASCNKFDVCVEWRTPQFCPWACPAPLSYQACVPTCHAHSCPSHWGAEPEEEGAGPQEDEGAGPEEEEEGAGPCRGLSEGCVCPAGTLLHRRYAARCVAPEQCACTDGSGAPRSPAAECARHGEVLVSLADEASCCPRRVCVCDPSLCEQLPPPTASTCPPGQKMVSYHRAESCCPLRLCECDPSLCQPLLPSCRDDQMLIATANNGSCCPANICVCRPCLRAAPACASGELLAVERDAAGSCCPEYHCVCDPHRCPRLTCPAGMSSVSAPGPAPSSGPAPSRCCPHQTCECSCEKVPSPKCSLGEAAQLDRSFLLDPQNQCACNRYKCVREAVCVFGERGVLTPGQTLVERGEDGACRSRQCSRGVDPASGFHLLLTASINCSAHCQPNQVYVASKEQCCGACRNTSCLHHHDNGTVARYEPGTSWVASCVKFDCMDTRWGATVVSYAISCPAFNDSACSKVGGTAVSYMDGCCRTCTGAPLYPFPVSPLSANTNCERGKEDGKSCQKVTVRMTIRKNDCRSNRPVNIVSCDGKCPSASIYNYNIDSYARFCKCCRETGLQRRQVALYCAANASWVSYGVQEPADCSCQWS